MSKIKRAPGKKSGGPSEDKSETLAQKLCDLAIEIAEREDRELMSDSLKQAESDFHKLIRKSLYQKKDDVLYESLERAKFADADAYRLLKENIEAAAGVILIPDDKGNMREANAFVIPIFVHSTGGLDHAQSFQDEEAFELLTKSFKDERLESRDASVVLVSHAYHLDELNPISYSHLNEMVHDAHASMTSKKLKATPAIDRSIAGWPENPFEPEDRAIELRFLLGFALKAADDPFYRVPADEEAEDAYFAAREQRFRRWAEQAAPLVKRCLVTDGREIDINFLYQDLFHGGKERGVGEYHMLQMMSDLNHGLQQHGVNPEQTKAIVGPIELDDEVALRVNLHAEGDGTLLAFSEKPIGAAHDLEVEAADACDALMTIGVKSLTLAESFDANGQPVGVRPYKQ
jgi:hypothetical protein